MNHQYIINNRKQSGGVYELYINTTSTFREGFD